MNKSISVSATYKYNQFQKQKERAKKILNTREIDTTTKVPVYIPSLKATIFVNPGVDVEMARAEYLSRRA
jgi:hemolysin activation/secretion protein